jgi:hypothetical protein
MITQPQVTFDLPPAPDKYSGAWAQSLIGGILRITRMLPYTPVPHVYLVSPNGSVYRVTVSNAGALQVALSDKTIPRPPL